MAYPQWIRPNSGSLGKIAAQQFYELELLAQDPQALGTITYSLVAGFLPRGLQVNPNGIIGGNPERTYTLTGVPFSVNQDITSTFTIRATNSADNSVTDRTFSIVVTGNFPPEILPTTTLIIDANVEENILGAQAFTSVNGISLSNGQIIKFVGQTLPTSYINNEYTVSGVGTSIVLIPYTQDIGTFLDGTNINVQLIGFDANDDPLSWKIIDGELPPGVSINENGLLTGLILPVTSPFNSNITGWSNAKWNRDNWEFGVKSTNAVYNFTVSLTDGKIITSKKYKMQVYAYNAITADNTVILSDNANITADIDANRPPLLLTTSLGANNTINSGGYFAFKFDGADYDGFPVEYNLDTGVDFGWDDANWDMTVWDKADFVLPPGLSLDINTGWLTGYIPLQAETKIDYTFGVYVNSTVGPYVESDKRLFTLTILGNLDLAIEWITDSDLGTIDLGRISNINVEAVAKSGRELFYTLDIDSKLPQGLSLLNDGALSGRVSFQRMSFDQGTTTFDVTLTEKFVYTAPTNFDNVYSFTITAQDYAGQISATKSFTIRIDPITYEPYENLFIRCLPPLEKRDILYQIISNTDIFDPDDIYRPLDPYYGLQPEIKFLVSYGIRASKLNEYIEAMKARHFTKNFYFGDFKIAQAKDQDGNALYDVLYVDLIEDTKRYETVNSVVKKYIPAASTNINNTKPTWKNPRAPFIAENQLKTSSAATVDKGFVQTNSSFYLKNALNEIFPNDLTLMQLDISKNLQNTFLNNLPEWMVSIQDDNNKILGYTSGAVLAYLKPGTGKKALFRMGKYVPYDIKLVPFVSDRYVLNNSYTANFNIETRKFVAHKYTTFDEKTKGGVIIEPVFNVDIAVDRPFDSINNQTLDYIVETNGLDGITYNLNDKYIIFATQQDFTGYGVLANDGWNKNQLIQNNYKWDDTVGWDSDVWDKFQASTNVVIPGYLEKSNLLSLTNQRAGVWQVIIDNNNVVTLNFIKEILPNQYVYVNQGVLHNNSYQEYDLDTLSQGYSVPKYTQSYTNILQPRAKTTFDRSNTVFINNIDTYTLPLQGDKYLKFPKIGVFSNGQ